MGKKTLIFSLITGLFLLLLSWKAVDVVLDHVIAPRAVAEQSGWLTRFFEPLSGSNSKGFEMFSKSAKIVPLHPEFQSATAYTVWTIPVTGPYQLLFSAEAVSTVAIDGKTILHTLPRSHTGRIEEAWIDLREGAHLIRVDMHNTNGGGTFSVGAMTPPLMWMKHLEGDMISFPRLGSLDTWWYVMVVTRPFFLCSLVLVILSLLALLLPLTIRSSKVAVAVTVTIVIVPAMLIPSYSKREPYFGDIVHRQLQKKQPDFVFIGNSMLWSRIDDEMLEQLLGGKPVHSIVNFGGMSAFLYLSFKYLLLPAQVNPKRVFFFFRGTTLTQPKIFTTGPYIEGLLQKVCPLPDPVYERLVLGRSSSILDMLSKRLNVLFPVQGNQKIVREEVNRTAMTLTLPGSSASGKQSLLRQQVNDRFSLDKTGTGEGKQGHPWGGGGENFDFNGMVDASFLPELIKLAREHHVEIAFIRVQQRPPTTGFVKDSPDMALYMKELKGYLDRNGASFYDFTGDPEVTLPMYAMGDHIAEPTEYTPIFAKRVKHLLQ